MDRRTLLQALLLGVVMPYPVLAQPFDMPRPWGQVLRTFGDPVLEGHFSIRVFPTLMRAEMVMWDKGDRILGMGQVDSASASDLWDLIAAILGRKPDVTIGPGSYMFRSDHYETAHWQLADDVAKQFGRMEEAERPHASSWMRPSRDVAQAVRPLSKHLKPPTTSGHILWTEPLPLVPGGPQAVNKIVLGQSAYPVLEERLARMAEEGRMLGEIDSQVAQTYIESLGELVPFAATLSEVYKPDGALWGRFRILTV